MATWTLNVSASGSPQDSDPIVTSQIVGFFGANYGDTITVGDYQSSVHILEVVGIDYCDNHPTNKIHSLSHIADQTTLLFHRAVAGSGQINLNTLDTADEGCFLYNFSHGSAVSTSGAIFYGYETGNTATPPTNVACWALEAGDANWSTASGSANALALTDQGSSANHNFYIGVSASPVTVGAKSTWKLRLELTYY